MIKLLQIFFVLGLTAFFLLAKFKHVEEKKVTTYYTKNIVVDSVLIEPEILTRWSLLLSQFGIRHPKVVLAQIVLETSYLNSKICRENNNLFGMKHNRRGYSLRVQNGHACYNNKADSFRDYAAWQKRLLSKRPCKSDEDYLYLLDHLPWFQGARYAEDPNYTNKLRQIMAEIEKL